MLFNSLHFLIFFPVVVLAYFSMGHRFRWIFLLCASYYFYMCWKPEYVLLIMASTLIGYYTGLQMDKATVRSRRKMFLILSLVSNLGILFAFKYFNLLNDSLRAGFNHFNILYNIPAFDVLLPIGISFYTFQTLSYTIEVYRGNQKPEKHLGIFALYVAFFPQLVAGPIERSTNLLPQFYQRQRFDLQRIKNGLLLMAWGFFKKLIIADRIAVLVNQIYNNPTDYSGAPLIIATYLFAFQIYCDFSGYSDIAIGGAQVLGIDLMKNFKFPYMAKSVSEFWKRWHISLSTWFRDYLYIPLGGNRVTTQRWFFNIIIVFLISGLWHGANWTFVIWGALHGFYILFSFVTAKKRQSMASLLRLDQYPKIWGAVKTFITFNLIVFAWIFFRANSISDAMYICAHLFSGNEFGARAHSFGINVNELFIILA
ncbi:MAG: MBOAT family protein, partial [Candidatus Omnitrophica bacterium]|nr:MBOAT family protein [Candidatus Omnitrophota bacterium]